MLIRRLLLVVPVVIAFAPFVGCGSSNGSSNDCEAAYNQMRACFLQVPDCSTCSSMRLDCQMYRGGTWSQICSVAGADCTCDTDHQAKAQKVLAATQTPANCCAEGTQ